jgi:nucleoside-diphosphate-sugar epimerase
MTTGNCESVLVTGGAGFIGSHLAKRLSQNGHTVQVIDNLWRGSVENLRGEDGRFVIDRGSQFHCADLTDYGNCVRFIQGVQTVYHLADVVAGVDFALREQQFIFRQNILINTNVLHACIENRIPNYIYVGTACSFPRHLQMSDGIAALSEAQTYPAEPESSYGWSKLMGEYEAELARASGALNIGLLRLHNVYGPGVSFDSERAQAIPSLIRRAIRYPEEPFIVWGSGQQYRDFIYVDDVIDALVLLRTRGMNCGVIQVGSEIATTIAQLAEFIITVSGKAIVPHYDGDKPQGDRGRVAICQRAKEILGWHAKTDLARGLELTYRWMKKALPPHAAAYNEPSLQP